MDSRRSGPMQVSSSASRALAALRACICTCLCMGASGGRLAAMQDPAPGERQLPTGSTPTASAMTPRRLVVCLDGTSNSDFDEQRRDQGQKVLKPTNVLKLCRAVLPWDEQNRREQIAYYEVGVGSLTRYPGIANRLLFNTDRALGGAYGAGFEANIESALSFLVFNYQPGDEVFIFGFSRGAATSRGLTRFLDWTGGRLPSKSDAYYLPVFFHEFVVGKGKKPFDDVLTAIDAERASEKPRRGPLDLKSFPAINVEFLGVWDTVMALGARFRATGASTSTASNTFYLDDQPAACVKNARQALAVDEPRFDFRPEVWKRHRSGQTLKQRWFAGAHSNVGGGLVDDGLANLAFHWMLDEARAYGLAVDKGFVSHYRGFADDKLYPSSPLYRFLDWIRGRHGRGKRQLTGDEMSLDRSVIQRIQADPKKFGRLGGQPYRPRNVLAFLACQPDLQQYLADLGVTTPLPADVLAQIQDLRQDCAKAGAKPPP